MGPLLTPLTSLSQSGHLSLEGTSGQASHLIGLSVVQLEIFEAVVGVGCFLESRLSILLSTEGFE